MSFPKRVKIVEVGPRDGLQNEATRLSIEARIDLIQALAQSGLRNIEIGSFISPQRLPQMADTAAVFEGLNLNQAVQYSALVPNMRGMQDALAAGVNEIAVFASASETFSEKNINCSIADSMARYREIIEIATEKDIAVRAYISCVMGCPYEGEISSRAVLDLASEFKALGCYEVSLGDTIGVGTPLAAKTLVRRVANEIGIDNTAIHFHDTYGQALANIYACLELGISSIDSAVAGLGGCPYAIGASGNVASEDLVYMLNNMGIETGVDLNQLVRTGRDICSQLDIPVRSKVNLAWRQHPK